MRAFQPGPSAWLLQIGQGFSGMYPPADHFATNLRPSQCLLIYWRRSVVRMVPVDAHLFLEQVPSGCVCVVVLDRIILAFQLFPQRSLGSTGEHGDVGGKGPHVSRWVAMPLFSSIRDALKSASVLVKNIVKELGAYMGSRGTNPDMADLLDNLTVCFDWGTLVDSAPTATHVTAFLAAEAKLRPYLAKTIWCVGRDPWRAY